MARRGRCAPARSTAKSPTAFAANGAPRSTPISDPSSKPHGEDRSEPSTPSASPSRAAPCLAQLENVNGDLSNYPSAIPSQCNGALEQLDRGEEGAKLVLHCRGPTQRLEIDAVRELHRRHRLVVFGPLLPQLLHRELGARRPTRRAAQQVPQDERLVGRVLPNDSCVDAVEYRLHLPVPFG